MAVGVFLEFPPPTNAGFDMQEGYERIGRELNGGKPLLKRSDWSPGLLAHAAGPTEDGGWCVTEVWESQEALDEFNGRLMPALGPLMAESGSEPQVRQFSVYRFAE
jgi:hypothetical protein